MGKRETKQTYKDTRNRIDTIGREQGQFRQDSSNIAEHHNTNADAGRTDLHGRYSSLADGGTYNPVNFERLGSGAGTYRGGGGGGGGGGGITAQSINYNAIGGPERVNFNAVDDPDRVNYNATANPDRVNYNYK